MDLCAFSRGIAGLVFLIGTIKPAKLVQCQILDRKLISLALNCMTSLTTFDLVWLLLINCSFG